MAKPPSHQASGGPAVHALTPKGDPSWVSYPQTILEIGVSPPLRVDLREGLAPSIASRLGGLGLGPSWVVLTAQNPRGHVVAASENERRSRELHEVVAEFGVPWLKADGVAVDQQHREAGLAIAIGLELAIGLARRFEQSALFWFDREAFWLIPALVEGAPVKLPPSGAS